MDQGNDTPYDVRDSQKKCKLQNKGQAYEGLWRRGWDNNDTRKHEEENILVARQTGLDGEYQTEELWWVEG